MEKNPDAIASAYGLQRLLEQYGVESTLCYDGRIDKLSASKMLDTFNIRMLPYEDLAADMRETDRIICVDTQMHTGNATDFVGDEIAYIDHHPTFVPIEYGYQESVPEYAVGAFPVPMKITVDFRQAAVNVE